MATLAPGGLSRKTTVMPFRGFTSNIEDLEDDEPAPTPPPPAAKQANGEVVTVKRINHWTTYENFIYWSNLIVPEDNNNEMFIPHEHYLQTVTIGDKKRWRAVRDPYHYLPEYLTDHKDLQLSYSVWQEPKKFFGPLDIQGNFVKKWDQLALTLLLYTASLTPYEVAFVPSTNHIETNFLFLLNNCVDLIFFTDMFVQMRTPYVDEATGQLVLSVRKITATYAKGWLSLDLLSVLPFDYIPYLLPSGGLDGLVLLRFVRLARLLKLLRVFRASRKLKKLQVSSGLRYATLEIIKICIITLFATHWLACGYRLAAQDGGWPLKYDEYFNYSTENPAASSDYYIAAFYYASGIMTLVGQSQAYMSPTTGPEFAISALGNLMSYFIFILSITSISHIFMLTNETKRKQDVLIDDYLSLFDELKLDKTLKFTVFEHLTDHFKDLANENEANLLRKLPVGLHGFIAMESFLSFVEQIPWLEPFLDREDFIKEVCRSVEIRSITMNALIFTDGIDGVYYIDKGIVALDGRLYITKNIFGLTALREKVKICECRALTNCQLFFLPRKALLPIMDLHPKIKYYCKRWTQWELVREYIRVYTALYYKAAVRGALLNPPLVSMRPNMGDDDFDDIDIAVLDHMQNGF